MKSKSLRGLEKVKMKGLLNFQISTFTNELNGKLKETESALNIIDNLRNKTAEILSKSNNPELEMEFRATCTAYQTNSTLYDPLLIQAYQDYLNAHQQKTSLYNITNYIRTTLVTYNTETETRESNSLETRESLDETSCITQLPNGKLFSFGYHRPSGTALLFDVNGKVKVLPSGTPCTFSSCIYFNNSVYCFGGDNYNPLTLSSRFDLDQNRWIQLSPIPKADYKCNSLIFNGNILISGHFSRNLWLYSIDINSFSTIPYVFASKKRKILINIERLYLIECKNGSIYESEIGSYMNWSRIIENSRITYNPSQVYCSYNKGGIYIGLNGHYYYKFDLNEKRLTKLKNRKMVS